MEKPIELEKLLYNLIEIQKEQGELLKILLEEITNIKKLIKE